jgi:hypothetical protein
MARPLPWGELRERANAGLAVEEYPSTAEQVSGGKRFIDDLPQEPIAKARVRRDADRTATSLWT